MKRNLGCASKKLRADLPGDFSDVWTPGIFEFHVTKLVG